MAVTYNKMRIDVNVRPEDIITAVQDDSDSRYLDVFLFDNGVPIDLTGHEVRIYMRKPEKGGEIFNDGEITEPENGRCQFLLTTAALEKTGWLQVQISIWKDNKEILSTKIFRIFVTESLRTTGSIEGSNEYGALVVLFQNLYQSIDLMTDMVQNFGKAGEVAAGIPAGTFWQMLEAVYAVNKDALENASVSEVLNRIGLTGDTGGSQTAGTVFGKENAILGKLVQLDNKVVNNMILKQTGSKNITIPSSGYLPVSFAFVKPVRILAIYMGGNFKGGSYMPVYIINGEHSFQTSLVINSAGSYAYYALAWDGIRRGSLRFTSQGGDAYEIVQDVWATRIDIQIALDSTNAGKTSSLTVVYQEEG